MKNSPHTLLLWLAIALSVVLLAPYAGVHILSSPPPTPEHYDAPAESPPVKPAADEDTQPQETTIEQENPAQQLEELRGLLDE